MVVRGWGSWSGVARRVVGRGAGVCGREGSHDTVYSIHHVGGCRVGLWFSVVGAGCRCGGVVRGVGAVWRVCVGWGWGHEGGSRVVGRGGVGVGGGRRRVRGAGGS